MVLRRRLQRALASRLQPGAKPSPRRPRKDKSDLVDFVTRRARQLNERGRLPTLKELRSEIKAAGLTGGNDLIRGVVNASRGQRLSPRQAEAVYGRYDPRIQYRFLARLRPDTLAVVRIRYEVQIDYNVRFTTTNSGHNAGNESVTKDESLVARFRFGKDNIDDLVAVDIEDKQQDIVDDNQKDAQEKSFIEDTETRITRVRTIIKQVTFS